MATADAALFPLPDNLARVFSIDTAAMATVEEAMGREVVAPDVLGTLLRTRDASGNVVRNTIYVVHGFGVRQYAAQGSDAVDRALNGTDLIRWPVPAGDTYVQADTIVDADDDADLDGRVDRLHVRAEITAVAQDVANTPAGNFASVFHHRQRLVITRLPSAGGSASVTERTTDTWLAPAHGPVRRIVTERRGDLVSTRTEALSGFRLGPRQNEAEAPFVLESGPWGRVNAGAQLSFRFSEPLDLQSLPSSALVVTNQQGEPVPGSVLVTPTTLRFTPQQPWSEGFYTVRLSGGYRDLLGNTQSQARSDTLHVDASAPGVTGSSPAHGAINVRLRSTLGIGLSEPPAPASVNAANVRLILNGSPVPAVLQATTMGISVEPVGGLQRGQRYTLQISGITDFVGNVMVQSHMVTFDTTPGRFMEPVSAVSSAGHPQAAANVVGDVTGDGVADLLYTQATFQLNNVYQYSLYLRAGRGGGAFADPVRLPTGPMDTLCDLNAIVVGDVTSDGRPDVVVGSLQCGIVVLRQEADGLRLHQHLGTPVNVLRLADLDGDGRLELLGAGERSTAVHVWRQGPGPALTPMRTAELGGEVARDLDVADLNRDGRPDLVVALKVLVRTPHIAVLLQQADGSFSAPVYLSTGSPWGADKVAIGDLNGDGRQDIVASTGGNTGATLALFHQAEDGTFGPVLPVPTLDVPGPIRIVDIDNDGSLDIVVHHGAHDRVGVYLQKSGALRPEELYDAPRGGFSPDALAVHDVDGDGFKDIVVSGYVLRHWPP